MGYYATGGGSIAFSGALDEKDLKSVMDSIWYECDCCQTNDGNTELDFWMDGKYFYDTEDILNNIAVMFPVLDGYAEFRGEDNAQWKFVYSPDSNKFVEVYGRTVYDDEPIINDNDRCEFIGQIIDTFEDFLEKKGVEIRNDEKLESESPAILYGTDYGELQSSIEKTMAHWGILK